MDAGLSRCQRECANVGDRCLATDREDRMRGNPHSYQSIAAQMVDPPEYLEDETGGMILCYECDEWAEGEHQETPMCGAHLKDAYLWDQADNMNQIGWEE